MVGNEQQNVAILAQFEQVRAQQRAGLQVKGLLRQAAEFQLNETGIIIL